MFYQYFFQLCQLLFAFGRCNTSKSWTRWHKIANTYDSRGTSCAASFSIHARSFVQHRSLLSPSSGCPKLRSDWWPSKGIWCFSWKQIGTYLVVGIPGRNKKVHDWRDFWRNVCWEDVFLTNMVTGVAVVAAVRRLEVIWGFSPQGEATLSRGHQKIWRLKPKNALNIFEHAKYPNVFSIFYLISAHLDHWSLRGGTEAEGAGWVEATTRGGTGVSYFSRGKNITMLFWLHIEMSGG